MKNLLPVKVGIWDTHYKLTRHRDGSITIRYPFTRWLTDSTATLDFRRIKVCDGHLSAALKKCFDDQTHFTAGCFLWPHASIREFLELSLGD